MSFNARGLTYFLKVEHRGIISIRLSMGYMDRKNEVYEMTFDI